MRGLVLVDLDNVMGAQSLEDCVEGCGRWLRRQREQARLTECVVCMAFNTTTVAEHRLTFAGLHAAARALAASMAEGEPRVELGLVLTMPQAADVLLARLAREAPCAEGAGRYAFAALVSKDRGLARSLASEVFTRKGWRELQGRAWPGVSWLMPSGGTAVERMPPVAVASGRNGVAPETSGRYTLCVDNGALAAWAGDRAPDVAPDMELVALADEVDRRPWLLSQVGATRRTLRGVDRLSRLPGPMRLGPLSPKDAVEVRGGAACPSEVDGPAGASVGIGAARFDRQDATVATRLPVAVLGAGRGPYQVDSGVLNLTAALQQVPEGARLGGAVRVHLSRRRSELVAEVEHSASQQPAAWWVESSKTTSVRRVDDADRFMPREATVAGVPMRYPGGRPTRLALRSPLDRGAQVTVAAAIAPGTIGTASNGEATVAVFSPIKPLAADATIVVDPIHTVSRGGRMADFPLDLWTLPLVVPR